MKKLITILLLVAYLIPAIGVGVNLHWCGEILFSCSVTSESQAECMCTQFSASEQSKKSDCCNDHYVYYKISDQHLFSQSENLTNISKNLVGELFTIFPLTNSLACITAKRNWSDQLLYFDDRPPERSLLGVFRI